MTNRSEDNKATLTYFLIGISSFHFINGIEQFVRKFKIEPAFWTTHPRNIVNLNKKFSQTVCMNAHDLTCADKEAVKTAIGVDKLDLEPLSPSFQEEFAKERLLVQENLLHRSDPFINNYTHSEIRDTVNNYFIIAYNLLKTYNPKFILYEVAPHTMYDLALYQLAENMGSKNILLVDTNIPSISFATTDFNNNRKFIKLSRNRQFGRNKLVKTFDEHIDKQGESIPFYMKNRKFSRSYGNMIYDFLKYLYADSKKSLATLIKTQNNLNKKKTGYQKKKGYLLHEKTGNSFSKLKKFILGVQLEILYKDKSKGFSLENVASYIYVPLSMQHERTTMPSARFMYDQKAYIKLLANNLPPKYTLIVKENPKQFTYIRGARTRDKRFYEELENLDVQFAPLEFSSHKLIKYSSAVAVTTGSAGFEAVVGHNKPVLKFANSWYQQLPGIYEINKGDDLKRFFLELENENCTINQEQVRSVLEDLKKFAIYLYPAGITVKKQGWDADLMSQNISALLEQELEVAEYV
ncbi:Capsule polysaccharide biosynthesis protein [Fodinibius roseus]|uniref:Capsule polysaccharide biosynthesis protein n=1 Tax=Fodinibius roseus TaxID=1194090 RepID=A0A1M5J1I1_9BACT|nr:hypothetical protein [Fodinibius roseus]SHG34468.1 Capsule polysaccharide biosynthesis protein [Fodinibius roseus]